MDLGNCAAAGGAMLRETLNFGSSAAFMIAAILCYSRVITHHVPLVMTPIIFMAAISLTSGWSHMHYSGQIIRFDDIMMGLFLVSYLYALHRVVWGQRRRIAWFWVILSLGFFAGLQPAYDSMPASAGVGLYAPLAAVLLVHSILLRNLHNQTSDGIFFCATLHILALIAYITDPMLCAELATGTHFLWHILAAVTGWGMVQVIMEHHKRAELEKARQELLRSLDDFAVY